MCHHTHQKNNYSGETLPVPAEQVMRQHGVWASFDGTATKRTMHHFCDTDKVLSKSNFEENSNRELLQMTCNH